MRSFLSSKSRALPFIVLIGAVALVVATVTIGAVMDGDDGWTQATAGVGLAATVVAAGVLLATGQGWANGTRLSFAALSVAIVGLGALALVVVTYVGSAGDVATGETNVVADEPASTTDEGLALLQQKSNNDIQPPGASHDVGTHPTLNGFMTLDNATILSNSPGGTLLPNEVGLVQEQLAQVRAFVETVDTIEKAQAAGFSRTTNDVPFMGAHYLNFNYVSDGVFDPSKPEGLLFSQLGGGEDAEWQLVGAWFLLYPGINPGVTESIPPEGFAGNLDLWHEHYGLCTRAGVISENNTAAGCAADNGSFIGDLRWMMHVWVWPEVAENPDGVFYYLNYNLFDMQNAQGNIQGEPLGGTP